MTATMANSKKKNETQLPDELNWKGKGTMLSLSVDGRRRREYGMKLRQEWERSSFLYTLYKVGMHCSRIL